MFGGTEHCRSDLHKIQTPPPCLPCRSALKTEYLPSMESSAELIEPSVAQVSVIHTTSVRRDWQYNFSASHAPNLVRRAALKEIQEIICELFRERKQLVCLASHE